MSKALEAIEADRTDMQAIRHTPRQYDLPFRTHGQCGALDAIFGIIGATLAPVWTRRKMFPELEAKTLRSSVVGLLVMNLVLGSSIPSIDQAAHLGGFLMGLVCGAALGRDVYSPRGLGGLFWTTVFAMVTAGACWGALTRWIAVDWDHLPIWPAS